MKFTHIKRGTVYVPDQFVSVAVFQTKGGNTQHRFCATYDGTKFSKITSADESAKFLEFQRVKNDHVVQDDPTVSTTSFAFVGTAEGMGVTKYDGESYAEVVAKEVRRPRVEPGTIKIDETTFSTPLQRGTVYEPDHYEECDAFRSQSPEVDRSQREFTLWVILFALVILVAAVMCFVLPGLPKGGIRS